MSKQPEALAPSGDAESMVFSATAMEKAMAAELRRLHAVNAELLEALQDVVVMAADAMFEANRDGAEYDIDADLRSAFAAIAKATGEQA